ncbi:hypothetical protein Taro_054509, partial [Colocasia esculenta]|nr:hypothetical protein [Colocasia esculenta]
FFAFMKPLWHGLKLRKRWVPSLCKFYNRIGHDENSCYKKNKNIAQKEKTPVDVIDPVVGIPDSSVPEEFNHLDLNEDVEVNVVGDVPGDQLNQGSLAPQGDVVTAQGLGVQLPIFNQDSHACSVGVINSHATADSSLRAHGTIHAAKEVGSVGAVPTLTPLLVVQLSALHGGSSAEDLEDGGFSSIASKSVFGNSPSFSDSPARRLNPPGISQNTRWVLGNGSRIRFLDDVCGRASIFSWLIPHRAVPVDDRIAECGIPLPSRCSCCKYPEAGLDTNMNISIRLWDIISSCSIANPHAQFLVKVVKLVRWNPPLHGLLLNVDGASKGNPVYLPKFVLCVMVFNWLWKKNTRWVLGNGIRIRFLDDVWYPQVEDLNHLFVLSDLAKDLWHWISPFLQASLDTNMNISIRLWDIISSCSIANPHGFISTYSTMLIIWEIWKIRCKMKFEQVACSSIKLRQIIHNLVNIALDKLVFKSSATAQQLHLIREFGFSAQFLVKVVKLVRWNPPLHGLLLNVNGASKGSPGPCGGGGIIRDSTASMRLAFSHFYGAGSSLFAEFRAMCDGVQLALEKGFSLTEISTDSMILVNSFQSGIPPSWECSRWWWTVFYFLQQYQVPVKHVYREANQMADALANFACNVCCNGTFTSSSDLPRSCFPAFIGDRLDLVSFKVA